jgi:hypothetical protein
MPRAVYNEPLAGTPPPSPSNDDDSVSIDSAGLAGDWDDDEEYELEPDPSDDDEEPASTSTAAAPPVATATAANAAPPVAATAPARKRGQKTSNASQLANVAKRQSKKEPKVSPQEIREGWKEHVKSVINMPFCKAANGSRNSKCQCLKFIHDTPDLVEPIANYMAQWSSCTKQQQDQTLLNAYIYASRTKENFGKGCHYQVPFDASLVEEAGLEDLKEIKGAGVCESAFFRLHNVGRKRLTGIKVVSKTSTLIGKSGHEGNTNASMPDWKKKKLEEHFDELKSLATAELELQDSSEI